MSGRGEHLPWGIWNSEIGVLGEIKQWQNHSEPLQCKAVYRDDAFRRCDHLQTSTATAQPQNATRCHSFVEYLLRGALEKQNVLNMHARWLNPSEKCKTRTTNTDCKANMSAADWRKKKTVRNWEPFCVRLSITMIIWLSPTASRFDMQESLRFDFIQLMASPARLQQTEPSQQNSRQARSETNSVGARTKWWSHRKVRPPSWGHRTMFSALPFLLTTGETTCLANRQARPTSQGMNRSTRQRWHPR